MPTGDYTQVVGNKPPFGEKSAAKG